MNPTEISDALEAIAAQPFDAEEFPYAFAAATGNAKATVILPRKSGRGQAAMRSMSAGER